MRLARQVVALALFFADRQQRDAGRPDAERHARVDAAHHGELQQVLRPAFDARAHVEQHGRTAARRNRRGKGRTIDARQHAERGVRRHDGRAGVTRAEERRRLAPGDGFRRDLDRGARFPPERRRRRLRHRHDLGRFDDAHAVGLDVLVPGELGVERGRRSDEHHAEVEVTGRGQRPVDHAARREVAAHRVNSDPDHSEVQKG